MRTAIFPGSFNPFTLGHKSIVDRALPLFDRIIIAIGVNAEKAESHDDELARRIRTIAALYDEEPYVEVRPYYSLTVDFAREVGASCILRGVRSVKDFEYELALADVNRRLSGIETIILPALPELSAISSSVVRELQDYGVDTSAFLPQKPDSL